MIGRFRSLLITGGAGFVGSRLALFFKQGWPSLDITVFDNLHRRGSERHLETLKRAGIRFVHGDVRLLGDLNLCPCADVLIEASAEPSVLAGYDDQAAYMTATNITGALNCLEWARRKGAALLFISTSRVYPYERIAALSVCEQSTRFSMVDSGVGISPSGINELFPLDGARTLYGATKLAAELVIEEYRIAFGLKSVIHRAGLLAGPGQWGKVDQGVVTYWVDGHLNGSELTYLGFKGSGKQVRDVLHIDDYCEAVHKQLICFDACDGAIFNIGGGLNNSVSLMELTQIVSEVTGCSVPISRKEENRPGDVAWLVMDSTRFQNTTGWRPQRDVRKVVEDIHEWLLDLKRPLNEVTV